MTAEMALRLGRAVAQRFRHPDRPGRIVIGKDTRLSGYMFERRWPPASARWAPTCMLCGPLPTPGIAFITSSMRADAGVVICACHNPYQDNGIKIFAADGFKLPDEVEARARAQHGAHRRWRRQDARRRRTRSARRCASRTPRGRYVAFLKSAFPKQPRSTASRSSSTARTAPPTTSRPRCFRSSGADVDRARRRAGRHEHQRRVRRAAPRDAWPRRCAQLGRHARHRARRRRRPRHPVPTRSGEHRRRRRGHGALRARACCARGELPQQHARRDRDVEPRPRARAGGAGRQARAHRRRRPLRRRGDARAGATTWAASSRGTSSSSTTRRPATASSRRCRCWRS